MAQGILERGRGTLMAKVDVLGIRYLVRWDKDVSKRQEEALIAAPHAPSLEVCNYLE